MTWIPLVLWMVVIFVLSGQPAVDSSGLSAALAAIVAQALDRALGLFGMTGFPGEGLGGLEHLLRKTAHFLEYFVLGSLALLAVRPRGDRARSPRLRTVGWAALLCAGYAVTDEVHQLFVPGRAGHWRDVLIDSAGAVTGILLLLVASGHGGRPRHAAGSDDLNQSFTPLP